MKNLDCEDADLVKVIQTENHLGDLKPKFSPINLKI